MSSKKGFSFKDVLSGGSTLQGKFIFHATTTILITRWVLRIVYRKTIQLIKQLWKWGSR